VTPIALVVHAHFYQPPRENPWTEEVPREPGAAPFHDWNARIAAECYRPNAFARILDGSGLVLDVVNNYSRLSFNVGPTLMSWLEVHQPAVYERIRAAHATTGGAIAQAWNHMILPLASERDMRTQVRWGLADFRHRFGTEPAGMWLPETAVNEAVLAVLAEEGVGFTILAPSQARAIRPVNRAWQEIGADPRTRLDTRVPYRWVHPAGDGRGLDIVFYDGGLSHALAFEPLPSEALVDRAAAAGGRRGGLVAVALDGETFGHHHKWTDRALAYALTAEAPRRGLEVTNLASWLRRHRPASEVRVRESAWSCAHGVGRWAIDCGCSTGGPAGSHQRWRAPLRAALDRLRDFGVEVFERRGAPLFAGGDPWAARDAYVDVLVGAASRQDFAARWVVGDPVEAFTLLEAQRHAMLMYTSCGWFFHDLAGLETVQVLRYAARVMDLLAEVGEAPPEAAFFDTLAKARSHGEGDGRRVWARYVAPARVDASRVAAHLVLADLYGLPGPSSSGAANLGGFAVESLGAGKARRPSGDLGLAWRRLRLEHRRTGRVAELVAVAVRTGDLEAAGAVRPAAWPSDAMALDALRRGMEAGMADPDLAGRLAGSFGVSGVRGSAQVFDLSAMLPEAAETLLQRVAGSLGDHLADAAESFLAAAHWAALSEPADGGGRGGTLPEGLRAPAEAAVAARLQRHLEGGELRAAAELSRRARRLGVDVDGAAPAIGSGPARAAADIVVEAVRRAVYEPHSIDSALAALALTDELGLAPDLQEAQELVHAALRARPRPDLAPLADALGLSPALFAQAEAAAPVP
jgi:alpha-amylase/alpha-mannosidase (GH57 family)